MADGLVTGLPSLLQPVEGWGCFRPGARPAAVAFVLYQGVGEWRVPFVRRRADLRSHPGQVGLPGGGVEAGEDAWAAACRETEEEIGLPATALVPLGAGRPVYAAVTNYSVVAFAAWFPGPDPVFAVERRELDGVLEVPLDLLLDESAWVAGPAPFPGRHLPVDGAMIWGLTARLLADILPPVAALLSR